MSNTITNNMKGYLLTLSVRASKDITKANYELFGRVSKVRNKRYYYAGILHDSEFIRLTDGCIFVSIDTNVNNIQYWNIYPCEIEFGEETAKKQTAKQKWKTTADQMGIRIRNL